MKKCGDITDAANDLERARGRERKGGRKERKGEKRRGKRGEGEERGNRGRRGEEKERESQENKGRKGEVREEIKIKLKLLHVASYPGYSPCRKMGREPGSYSTAVHFKALI